MSARAGLIVLQAIGAIALIPWPAVLVASIMSLAAERPAGSPRFTPISILFLLAPLYPAIWIGLDIWSWRALRSGLASRAFTLSAVPLLLSVVAAGVWYWSDASVRDYRKTEARKVQEEIEPRNPLVWKLLCAGGSRRLAAAPHVSIEEALQAIRASSQVNDAVPVYGTPLQTALKNLCYHFDGTPCDGHQEHLGRLVDELLQRGAQLAPAERSVMLNAWLLRRAGIRGPVTTARDNPLVWRIVTRSSSAQPLTLTANDATLLNKSTPVHGTPLHVALLTGQRETAAELVRAGARLSPEEASDPADARALERLFQEFQGLEDRYR